MFVFRHAQKISSRRFPQRSLNSVAYKSDGKKSSDDDDDDDEDSEGGMKAAVATIKKSVKEYKEAVITEAKSQVEAAKLEAKAASDLTNAEIEKLKVTILDLQGKVVGADAKANRKTRIITKQEFGIGIQDSMFEVLKEHEEELKELAKQTSDKALKGRFPLEVKVPGVVTSGSLSGVAYNTIIDWRPGMEPTGTVHFRDLVRTIESDFDVVHYPRANVPVGQGSVGKQVNETDAKAQVDRGYTMIDLTLKAYAGYIIVSRPSLRNLPFLATWLPVSLNENLLDYEDQDFSQTLVAAANAPTTGIGTSTTGINADNFIKLIKNLKKTKFSPTAIACDPDVWANMLIYKASGSGQYTMPIGTVNVSPNGVLYFLGIPVYPVVWLTGGRVIVGDWTKAAIVQSEGLSWRMSENVNDTFIKNEVTFLIERVEGLAIFRTDAFATAVFNNA